MLEYQTPSKLPRRPVLLADGDEVRLILPAPPPWMERVSLVLESIFAGSQLAIPLVVFLSLRHIMGASWSELAHVIPRSFFIAPPGDPDRRPVLRGLCRADQPLDDFPAQSGFTQR